VSSIAAALGRTRTTYLLACAATAIGLIALSGCGSSKKESSGTTESTPAATTPSSTQTSSTSTGSSSSGSGSGGGSSSVSLEANPEGQLSYNTTSLSAKAGNVTIDFKNASPVGHNVTIESSSGQKVGATPTFTGGSKTLTANLKPGTYKFFCSVPGHRQAGMEGTLTVK
jgi:plastocyanin